MRLKARCKYLKRRPEKHERIVPKYKTQVKYIIQLTFSFTDMGNKEKDMFPSGILEALHEPTEDINPPQASEQ